MEVRIVATATGGSYDRRDFAFTADLPISSTLLSTISVSSQNQTGWQKVIPYPSTTPYGQAPFVVDPQNVYPKPATRLRQFRRNGRGDGARQAAVEGLRQVKRDIHRRLVA